MKPVAFDESYVKTVLERIHETHPHIVLIYDLPKALMMTASFDGKTPAIEWLKDRAKAKLDWFATDLGIFDGGPFAVAFRDADLAFEFKMRWA